MKCSNTIHTCTVCMLCEHTEIRDIDNTTVHVADIQSTYMCMYVYMYLIVHMLYSRSGSNNL
jgi:hypothetical protein